MTNDEVREAVKAGEQAKLAEVFKFEQAKRLIHKLLPTNVKNVDVQMTVECLRNGQLYVDVETNDLFECFEPCGRQVWDKIRLGNFAVYFRDEDSKPGSARLTIQLHWWYHLLAGGSNGMDFATICFDRNDRPNEWQAKMTNGEIVTLD